jgi:hypothetical protein
MAITAHKLRRAEVWSTWVAAGGVRQAVIDDATILTATSNILGTDHLDLTLPLVSPAAPFVVPNAVIRIEESDSVFDEWIIMDGPNDDDGTGLRTVQVLPIRAAMAKCDLVRRINGDGTSSFDFDSVGLTPSQHISGLVLPTLARGGMSWIALGTITPTKLLDLTFTSGDTPISVLERIAAQTAMELDIRRTGGGYAIDLVPAIGSAQPVADLRFDKNLQPGTKRNRSSLESATRIFPFGASEDEQHATMARATWQVTNIAGLVVTLADPAGGAGPIQFDGQLAGLNGTTQAYLRKPGGTLTIVTASSFSGQTVTVASVASLAVNDLVQFRSSVAGDDLLWLDSPPDRLLYGLNVATVDMPDIPSTNNLLKNSVMRSWPGSSSAPPPNWTSVGGGTVAKQSASPFTRVGGNSIHRVGVADGDGVISDAVPISAIYVSGYAGLWVVSGQVRVELVFTTGGGPVVQPLPPDFATNSILGQWEDLGVAGIAASALGATAVALRVVQHGAPVADFYLDYGQVTESPSQLPLAESSGGTRLWQAANEKLRTGGAPLVSYEVKIVDLANIDPATWGVDCKVVVGGTVRVIDPRMSIAITTRLVEMTRDYKVWGDTAIKLSNKYDDITRLLGDSFSPTRAPTDVSEGPGIPFTDFSTVKLIPSAGIALTGNTAVRTVAGTGWDQQVYSKDGFTGGAFASCIGNIIAGTSVIFGLNTDPTTDASYTSIDYSVQVHEDGFLYAHESGVFQSPAVAFVAGDQIAIVYDGTTVRWMKNGTVFRTVAVAAGIKFFLDSSFSGIGTKLSNIRFGPMSGNQGTLATRARVIATTATTITVRVAVADPIPQGTNSATIAYQDLGSGGVSPASGGTVTPAATLTEAAGTFIDYTVTRPAFGAGAGRVTFTATAANRTSSSDAVDVPEVDRDTIALGMRARVTATTASTLTVRVAVADPFPQGAASGSIATQDLGVGSATTPSSPQTVTPASTITEAAGTFVDYTVTRPAYGAGAGRVTFSATATGRTGTFDAIDVPEQGSANLGSSRLRCGLKRSGALSVTQNADIAVGFDTEDFDVGGLHDTVTNNSYITIPTGGGGVPWLFAMLASWGNNADTTQRKVSLWKNGALLADGVAVLAINGNTTQQTFTWMDVPADGDHYEMYVRHNAAAPIPLDIASKFRGVSLW